MGQRSFSDAVWRSSQASGMARKPRKFRADEGYPVMNRAAGRLQVFHKDADHAAFEKTLPQPHGRYGVPILAYVAMPNHFHLVLRAGPGRKGGSRTS